MLRGVDIRGVDRSRMEIVDSSAGQHAAQRYRIDETNRAGRRETLGLQIRDVATIARRSRRSAC
jgi:hypothetical protein